MSLENIIFVEQNTNRKKKILMVCEAFGGGVFAYVTQLCNDMVNSFDIYLAYSLRPQTPNDFKSKIDSRVKLIEIENFGDLKKILSTIKRLKNIEREIKPDIIHLHSSIAGAIGRLAFNGKNNVLLYTPHGYAHILLGNGFKSRIYRLIEKILAKRKAITLTCCESEDEEARKFSNNTAYIETGINVEKFDKLFSNIKQNKNDRFTVFTLGRICRQKQPSIFNEIALHIPEAKFVWIGSGELEKELTAPNIEVTGWKSREEALQIAKSADAFILCSLGEAIAMSLLENMYIKKLCLVSNVMGNKSVIINNFNGYVCSSIEEYVNDIKNAMKDYPNKLVERAFNDVVNKYNTNVMSNKFISFYNKICMDVDSK